MAQNSPTNSTAETLLQSNEAFFKLFQPLTRLLVVLFDITNQLEKLPEKSEVSRRQIFRLLRSLEKQGLIERYSYKRGKPGRPKTKVIFTDRGLLLGYAVWAAFANCFLLQYSDAVADFARRIRQEEGYSKDDEDDINLAAERAFRTMKAIAWEKIPCKGCKLRKYRIGMKSGSSEETSFLVGELKCAEICSKYRKFMPKRYKTWGGGQTAVRLERTYRVPFIVDGFECQMTRPTPKGCRKCRKSPFLIKLGPYLICLATPSKITARNLKQFFVQVHRILIRHYIIQAISTYRPERLRKIWKWNIRKPREIGSRALKKLLQSPEAKEAVFSE
jgi:DNA-binding PadR family transcriptional regulator